MPADARGGKHRRQPPGSVVELLMRQRAATEDERRPVGVCAVPATNRLRQHQAPGALEIRHHAHATSATAWTSGGSPIIARMRPMKNPATASSATIPLGRYHCQMLL